MPELVTVLLEAEPAERERLLRSADAAALEPALTQLGHTRQPAAAEVLAMVDSVVEDRGLRKAARRELHRLRSMGIEPPPAVRTMVAPVERQSQARLDISEAWATDLDPAGSRAVWLLAERPLGGVWFAALLLNDLHGLQDVSLVDTTRKRFQQQFDESRRSSGRWVELPGDYALRLIREAVDLSHELGGALPTRYHAFRDVFGEAPGPPERALVYETISPVELNFNPDWLDESPRLLAEPELAGWYVPLPAELRPRALEVARGSTAALLVPGHPPEQQVLQFVAEAAHAALGPVVRRALRRRLEETAYIFVATERLSAARLAAAAARPLETENFQAERHPLLRLLIAGGLARLVGGEVVGGRRASDVLLELIERASQHEGQAGRIETRPSGLILPR